MRLLVLFIYVYVHALAFVVALVASFVLTTLLALGLAELDFNKWIIFVLRWTTFLLANTVLMYGMFIMIDSLAGNWYRRATADHHSREIRCLSCKYDLRGNLSDTCPECGTKISWTRQQKIKQGMEDNT